MLTINSVIAGIKADIKLRKVELEEMIARGDAEGRTAMTAAENKRSKELFHEITGLKENLATAERTKAEDDEADRLAGMVVPTGVSSASRTATVHIGEEPRTYSRDKDPEGKGTEFLTDVIGSFRGAPQSTERLSRHMREWEVDRKGMQTRAAGDVTSGALPNLIIPQYLVDLYAAKPSAARPFADIMRHENLPAEGMKVELAKGNTVSTGNIQTSELVAPAGGNHDDDPLELAVKTAEAWQLVSRQSIDRGRVVESVVMGDLLDQVAAVVDSTIITEATTGLYDSGTRITYDSASPTMTELYPLILQGASKISQALLNRGKPTHVLMHPRRWYWLQSLLGSTWPMATQPGVPTQAMMLNTGGGYGDGIAGVLPCGLKVVMDANVQTAALAGAQTGGTQDIIYVVPENESILFEEPGREKYIRAEAPNPAQLGITLVVYEYFTYTFGRYATTAFQRINGTGTVPPTGF